MRKLLLLLLLSSTAAHAAPVRLFIAGDSTAAEYGPERAPQAGWGQMLQSYLDPARIEVHNHAKGGRSTRSFIDEGRLDPIAAELRRGDVLLIQFGHNDAKFEDPTRYTDPDSDYPQLLMRYVQVARDKGATPVLVTPVARLLYDFGSLLDTHARYTLAMQRLAAREHVALIDLNDRSMRWIRAMGEQGARPYFLFVPEQNKADGTHFSAAGANAVACLVLREAVQVLPTLQPALVRDIDCDVMGTGQGGDPARATQVVHEDTLARAQPGPHGGAGPTTAYPFFADAQGLPFVLRKRVLHKGAGIGLHPQHKDEIYYIVSGQGSYVLDGKQHDVRAGHALLTRTGSTHALQQVGEEDLVVLLVYPR
ncbi:GDSL-type esterase/lipase family protein [Stenotrophomonas lactitubi]|uniref:GDSL-type esterase/lipase family protein n=1 Tax=Stenotrophomonas lactitubi TaxID=2045214 RepID=UPI001D87C274|nr:GDSL-type esterase/lipase family protein [Stenotrophomonas lactitubi]CAH0126167.1 putative rhamnogalacturonan acetylesterase YesY [Stenotrophomonas lactitubi]CAH0136968.1 putative rhamnogalacturonan acetylesterase YesY [Stenotrophomonas lactitubi]CAH0147723.1 putative rhamnogalacturonan acetylesterase YesY [Stenotrophomonas lactitubi]CAH0160287.1 putative rhamnogalacturonan acetylesterase YesY [Stenotrophomonas lactitubi]